MASVVNNLSPFVVLGARQFGSAMSAVQELERSKQMMLFIVPFFVVAGAIAGCASEPPGVLMKSIVDGTTVKQQSRGLPHK